MQILLFIILLIVGGLINLLFKAKARFVRRVAVVYILLAVLISAGSWLYYCGDIKNEHAVNALSLQLNAFGAAGHLLLGYLMTNIFLALTSTGDTDSLQVKKIINLTLWALAILTGSSFITESYWKLENFCDMNAFFTSSGYTTWFLYFIMIAEAVGGVGILLHFKLKTGPFAVAGLMLIMIGALYTHNHNKDAFANSYAAFGQFITLGLMQVLYYFEQSARPKPLNFSLSANNQSL
jgi:uncharacterized membrane protein YphA (DoxX/SURF4 family)